MRRPGAARGGYLLAMALPPNEERPPGVAPVREPWPGVLYFAVVFGTGFVLGPIRMLWLVPRVGARTAELLEAPVMLVAIVLLARWVVRRCRVPATLAAAVRQRMLHRVDAPAFMIQQRIVQHAANGEFAVIFRGSQLVFV